MWVMIVAAPLGPVVWSLLVMVIWGNLSDIGTLPFVLLLTLPFALVFGSLIGLIQVALGLPVFLLVLPALPQGWDRMRRQSWAAQATIPLGLVSSLSAEWLLFGGLLPVFQLDGEEMQFGVVGSLIALVMGRWAARKAFAVRPVRPPVPATSRVRTAADDGAAWRGRRS